jgi:ubiquinone/menaquinone biosynthesis C-methylase UbiE
MTLRQQFLDSSHLQFEKNVFYQKGLERTNSFEKAYLKLREKEKRVHSDAVVRKLPDIDAGHANKLEWEMRKLTVAQLIQHLNKASVRTVLELGCGSGWLSYNLAVSLAAEICALDINEMELTQGARVFRDSENLCFLYADIFGPVLKSKKFDAILLGGSIQYFKDLSHLMQTLFPLMNPKGIIYIFDSPLYQSQAAMASAKLRTKNHFISLGFPEMVEQYFHHTFDELKSINYTLIYNPRSISSLIKRKIFMKPLSIFPMITIAKPEHEYN